MSREFKNTFSWSVSRDAVLKECPRKYYFEHYGFWDGWHEDAPRRTREIYVLKQLLNRWTWIGQTVHGCIARSLRNLKNSVPVLPLDEILDITRKLMRQDFRHSRRRQYRVSPKTHCGLFEHEYEVEVSDDEWREAAETVDRCLVNFYESEVWRELAALPPDDFLEVERFSSSAIDGDEIRIKLDCATRKGADIVIWDWKTGRREKDVGLSVQMACYAYYAKLAYRVPLDHIITRRFDLQRKRLSEYRISDPELGEILDYIRGSIKDMRGLLDDPANNTAHEDRFRKEARAEVCLKCNFFKVCKPDLD